MWQYVLKRLLLMIPTVIGAAFLIFFLLRALPGDVCELREGGEGGFFNPEQIELCRDELGLNDSIFVQFGIFVADLAVLDLGNSTWTGDAYGWRLVLFAIDGRLTFARW